MYSKWQIQEPTLDQVSKMIQNNLNNPDRIIYHLNDYLSVDQGRLRQFLRLNILRTLERMNNWAGVVYRLNIWDNDDTYILEAVPRLRALLNKDLYRKQSPSKDELIDLIREYQQSFEQRQSKKNRMIIALSLMEDQGKNNQLIINQSRPSRHIEKYVSILPDKYYSLEEILGMKRATI